MVGYTTARKTNTFTMDDVYKLVGNKKTASSLVFGCKKRFSEWNNLYTCINVADEQPVATKYHIACAVR